MGTYVPSGASLFLLKKFNSNLYTYVHNFSLLHVFLSMVPTPAPPGLNPPSPGCCTQSVLMP